MTMAGIQALATISDATTADWVILAALLFLAIVGTYFTVMGAELQWGRRVPNPLRALLLLSYCVLALVVWHS